MDLSVKTSFPIKTAGGGVQVVAIIMLFLKH